MEGCVCEDNSSPLPVGEKLSLVKSPKVLNWKDGNEADVELDYNKGAATILTKQIEHAPHHKPYSTDVSHLTPLSHHVYAIAYTGYLWREKQMHKQLEHWKRSMITKVLTSGIQMKQIPG